MAQDLTLKFRVTDEGTILLDKISQKISGIDESAKKMNSSLSLIKLDSLINLGARVMSVAGQFEEFFKIGAKAKQIEDSFNMVTASVGVMGDQIIGDIKRASGVFVDETGAMVQAQRLLIEGVAPKDVVKIFESARVAARLMGIDVVEATDRITEALISLRTRGLKAAFPMDAEEVIKKYAKALEILPDELSEVGKRQALINEVLRQTEERIGTLGPLIETEAEKLQKYRSAWDQLKESVSKVALTLVGEGLEAMKKVSAPTEAWGGKLAGGKKASNIMEAYLGIGKAVPAAGVGEWPSETRFINYIVKTIEEPPMKDVIDNTKRLENAFKELGVVSQEATNKMAQRAYDNMLAVEEAYKRGEKTVADYVRSIQAASKAIEKLTPSSIEKAGQKEVKDLTDLYINLEDEIRKIGDDPDRAKKVQALIDSWSKGRSKIMEDFAELKDKIKIPTQVDVEPAKEALKKFIDEANKNEITIKVKTESTGAGESINVWGIPAADFFKGEGVEGNASLNIWGIGSSKKPITEKIQEIIGEFGGLEKAMSGMEAEINLAELTSEYNALQKKLAQVERILPDLSNIASASGGSPYVGGPIVETVKDLTAQYTEQMKILQMKMNYEAFKAYAGEAQTGVGYVPRTAFYKVHEGERILRKNVSVGDIHIHLEGGQDPVKAVVKALKFRLSGELEKALS
jgi:tetratricopeptide (TPR) repeat protein